MPRNRDFLKTPIYAQVNQVIGGEEAEALSKDIELLLDGAYKRSSAIEVLAAYHRVLAMQLAKIARVSELSYPQLDIFLADTNALIKDQIILILKNNKF